MYNLNSNNKINYSEKHKNLNNKAKKYKTSISLELLHNDEINSYEKGFYNMN